MDVRVGLSRKLSTEEWMLWTVVLEKTLESPLDRKEIQPVHPKGNQCWIFTGRTDVEAETPVLWPPDVKSWLIGKDPDAGKNGRREEKGTTEGEMDGITDSMDMSLSKLLEAGDGQGGLVWCRPWSRRVRHDWATELNWTELRGLSLSVPSTGALSSSAFASESVLSPPGGHFLPSHVPLLPRLGASPTLLLQPFSAVGPSPEGASFVPPPLWPRSLSTSGEDHGCRGLWFRAAEHTVCLVPFSHLSGPYFLAGNEGWGLRCCQGLSCAP